MGDGGAVQRRNGMSTVHWAPKFSSLKCNNSSCLVIFSVEEQPVHCHRCGILYCQSHCSFRMKLNLKAEPDEKGSLVDVCQDCFLETFEDLPGAVVMRDKTAYFAHRRERFVTSRDEKNHKVISTLKKLSEHSHAGDPNGYHSLVVRWEEDETASCCPFCQQSFGWFRRKHHCRLCGRVVCAGCSDHSVTLGRSVLNPQANGELDGSYVRACKSCYGSLEFKEKQMYLRDEVTASLHSNTTLLYLLIRNTKSSIASQLAKFQDALSRIQSCQPEGFPALIEEAMAADRALSLSFTDFERDLKSLLQREPASEKDEMLKKQMNVALLEYIQDYGNHYRVLQKHLKKIAAWKTMAKSERDTVASAFVLIAVLARENEIPKFETESLGEAFKACLERVRYELEEAAYVMGDEPELLLKSLNARADNWSSEMLKAGDKATPLTALTRSRTIVKKVVNRTADATSLDSDSSFPVTVLALEQLLRTISNLVAEQG